MSSLRIFFFKELLDAARKETVVELSHEKRSYGSDLRRKSKQLRTMKMTFPLCVFGLTKRATSHFQGKWMRAISSVNFGIK